MLAPKVARKVTLDKVPDVRLRGLRALERLVHGPTALTGSLSTFASATDQKLNMKPWSANHYEFGIAKRGVGYCADRNMASKIYCYH